MANYSTTRRNAVQYAWGDLMKSPEYKMKPSAVLEMLIANTGNGLLPAKEMARINAVKETDQDTVEVSLLDRQATTAATARAAAHTGSINDSTTTTLSFATKAEKFKYSIKQADRDSVFTLDQMNSVQFLSAMI